MDRSTRERKRIEVLEREILELRFLCAELVQVMRTSGAPERVLQKLIPASRGKPIPQINLLPITASEFEIQRGKPTSRTPFDGPRNDTG
jgi:hypothetical protein